VTGQTQNRPSDRSPSWTLLLRNLLPGIDQVDSGIPETLTLRVAKAACPADRCDLGIKTIDWPTDAIAVTHDQRVVNRQPGVEVRAHCYLPAGIDQPSDSGYLDSRRRTGRAQEPYRYTGCCEVGCGGSDGGVLGDEGPCTGNGSLRPSAAGEFSWWQGHCGAGWQLPARRVDANSNEPAGQVVTVHANRVPGGAGALGERGDPSR